MTAWHVVAAVIGVCAGYGLYVVVQAWREDTRQAGIRQEMQKDHMREEWLKKCAAMNRREYL